MSEVIVLTGPTASGKTAVSIELAKLLNGEIVSADSMQIYKYMNIGTAKPSEEEKQGINHYMINIISPDENYSVARYKQNASKFIEEIIAKGKTPIVSGGTGLYINSLVYNIKYSDTETNFKLRNELIQIAESKGNDYVYNMLSEMDPKAASRLHKNNLKRVVRAIEVYKSTGKSIIEHEAESRLVPPAYKYKIFCLNFERNLLYDKINERVDLMIKVGLVEEVSKLVQMGYSDGLTAMQAIGYKELLAYLKGKASLDESIDTIKRETRRYAKRQMTWMKKITNINMIDLNPSYTHNNIAMTIAQKSGFM